jgi:putative transposase
MPRRKRLNLAGVPQHLVQRGNNRQDTFFSYEDYQLYREWLSEAAEKYECRIHAYVLMTNHVHLLACSARPDGLSLMMQYVGRFFVRYINRRYERSGTLYEGRFRSSLVDTDHYFLRCCRYIELNPVRACLARNPEDYAWSSYPAHASGAFDPLLTLHEQYRQLGSCDAERQQAYRELFRGELDTTALREIRDAVNLGWPLGSDRFKDSVEHMLNRTARPAARGRPRKSSTRANVVEQRRARYRLEKLH